MRFPEGPFRSILRFGAKGLDRPCPRDCHSRANSCRAVRSEVNPCVSIAASNATESQRRACRRGNDRRGKCTCDQDPKHSREKTAATHLKQLPASLERPVDLLAQRV